MNTRLLDPSFQEHGPYTSSGSCAGLDTDTHTSNLHSTLALMVYYTRVLLSALRRPHCPSVVQHIQVPSASPLITRALRLVTPPNPSLFNTASRRDIRPHVHECLSSPEKHRQSSLLRTQFPLSLSRTPNRSALPPQPRLGTPCNTCGYFSAIMSNSPGLRSANTCGSSPSPTNIVDTPASMADPRVLPIMMPIRKAYRMITLLYVS